MPLKGLSWARFREHLRKTMPIYIVGIVIMLFVSDILFTSTRPQVPDDQEVLVYIVDTYSTAEMLENLCADALVHVQQTDETLQSVEAQSITYSDSESDYTSNIVLIARMSVGDGDVYIVNESALSPIAANGVCYPLDTWIEEGWMEDLGLEPWVYTEEDVETGESVQYTAALKLTNISTLYDNGIVSSEDMYLIIASNGTNIETSKEVITYMIEQLAEGNYAPTATEEPAA